MPEPTKETAKEAPNQSTKPKTINSSEQKPSYDYVETRKDKVDFTKGGVDNYKFYPDNPNSHHHKYNWVNKEPSKFYDPCEQSRQASINCVLRNQDDRSVCQAFFDAYTECRRDFFKKKKEDRQKGKGGWGFWD
ncbi:Mitochondrial copper homeostasis protein [Yamadazyma tenuis]|uniref:Cytochrome c oxidase-assembly factor COX23, mitochondrial n=1 Tax=Candida tenuis (strain ATCC 10573 / BCRC 21748 / CBS 615 / JCM 9827 / NBRC 10315 / NRRL Y-1498 / VKM Y-70) TaxID=590646 RepID=G3BF26_CANTC|nr:uncharacterized protein CANTEDRAFT_111501 [Yamadazyma tenuis ATCC 10573]EGV60615.1 hypothetical protein CANTEDRAFT_111501 [Yamadazyma tenuis ATCC 10573]WEJ94138.1 Mitochondrial copper homeostasis protein [Yamadazyma tenuis]